MAKKFDRIYVELSNVCNFSCPFCPNSELSNRQMSLVDVALALKEAATLTNEVCLHVMGEPLMYPHLADVLALCKSNNLKINLVTNGYFFSQKMPLLTEYISVFNKVCISLHGYAYRTGATKDSLENIFRASVTMADLGVAVEIRNLLAPASDHFVQSLKDSFLAVTGTVLKDVYRNQKIKERCYFVVKKKFSWPSESKYALTPSKHTNNKQCLGGKAHIAILANLVVVPCCLDSMGEIILGDLHTATLQEILDSDTFVQFRQIVASGKAPHKLCATCEYHKIR